MEKYLKDTAQLVKTLNVKNKKEYNMLKFHYKILSLESLKYILQERDCTKLLKKLKNIEFVKEDY